MKYKIIELNERDLENFNGNIIQVLEHRWRNVASGYFLGEPTYKQEWLLTCLVEAEEHK